MVFALNNLYFNASDLSVINFIILKGKLPCGVNLISSLMYADTSLNLNLGHITCLSYCAYRWINQKTAILVWKKKLFMQIVYILTYVYDWVVLLHI